MRDAYKVKSKTTCNISIFFAIMLGIISTPHQTKRACKLKKGKKIRLNHKLIFGIIFLLIFNSPKAFGEFQTLVSPPPNHSIFVPFSLPFALTQKFFQFHFYFAMAPIDSTWPSLPKLALTFPNLPKLGLAQFGFGDFPKPMHWSLLRICLRAP